MLSPALIAQIWTARCCSTSRTRCSLVRVVPGLSCLGEQIQRTYPHMRVVKTLNTMNAAVMVNPGLVPGDHCVFVAGNDGAAKSEAEHLLETFGWPTTSILDLGDITAARATEMFLPMWLCICGTLGTSRFNIRVVQSTPQAERA
jgi:8-hydroxy-5-deazaflavin:NADPH oxidoreductase